MSRKKLVNNLPSALTGEIWLHTPHAFRGLTGGAEVPVVRARNPPLTGVLGIDLERILGFELRENLLDITVDGFIGLIDVHVGNGADRELADDLGRDDSLGAGGGEGAFDAVNAE